MGRLNEVVLTGIVDEDNRRLVRVSANGLTANLPVWNAGKTALVDAETGTDVSFGVITYPTPSNNKVALFGDSRSAIGSYGTSTSQTERLQPNGFAPWLLLATGYRIDITDVYAVAGQDLWYNRDQLTGVPGIASLVYKGNALSVTGTVTSTNPAPSVAGTFIMLAGVNGINGGRGGGYAGSSTLWDGTFGTKPFYDEIISAFVAANKVVVLCNEIPNSGNGTGTGTVAQLERRVKLDEYPTTSPLVVKVNTWDAMASAPRANNFKPGFVRAAEDVHPSIVGARALGEALAPAINAMFAAFPPRNQLPSSAAQSGWMFSSILTGTPTTGSNITGDIANGFTAAMSADAGLTCTASLVTSPDGWVDQVFTITGTGTAAANTVHRLHFGRYNATVLNAGSAASPIALNGINTVDGDKLYCLAGITVDAGNSGLLAIGPQLDVASSTVVFSGSGISQIPPPSPPTYSGDFGGMLLDREAMLSQPVTLPTGWSTGGATSRLISPRVTAYFWGDRAINFTIRIRRFGLIRNV